MKTILSLLFSLCLMGCVTDTTNMVAAEVQQREVFNNQYEFIVELINGSDIPEPQKILLVDELENNSQAFEDLSDRQLLWLQEIGEFDWEVLRNDLLNEVPTEVLRGILTPPEVDAETGELINENWRTQ